MKKRMLSAALALLLAGASLPPALAATGAAETGWEEEGDAAYGSQATRPLYEWNLRPGVNGDRDLYIVRKTKEGTEERKLKFIWLFDDDQFFYYMDAQNLRWLSVPYVTDEKMVDAWLRLVPRTWEESVVYDEDGNPSPKFYLEHYYIRPKRQQIQFLCELEVTGQPSNVITERDYDIRHWENLVPGSVEDMVYHSVLAQMKRRHVGGHAKKFSTREILNEYLRIGIW